MVHFAEKTAGQIVTVCGIFSKKRGASMNNNLCIGILTVSDRGWRGETEDRSGPALRTLVETELVNAVVTQTALVPDEQEQIAATLRSWADDHQLDLVLTTGGTGFAPRDVTPEAMQRVIERETPGLVQAMLSASLAVTPHAMLSRSRAGIRGRTLIVNLPGSPKAACENLRAILPAIPHGLALLRESQGEDRRH